MLGGNLVAQDVDESVQALVDHDVELDVGDVQRGRLRAFGSVCLVPASTTTNATMRPRTNRLPSRSRR